MNRFFRLLEMSAAGLAAACLVTIAAPAAEAGFDSSDYQPGSLLPDPSAIVFQRKDGQGFYGVLKNRCDAYGINSAFPAAAGSFDYGVMWARYADLSGNDDPEFALCYRDPNTPADAGQLNITLEIYDYYSDGPSMVYQTKISSIPRCITMDGRNCLLVEDSGGTKVLTMIDSTISELHSISANYNNNTYVHDGQPIPDREYDRVSSSWDTIPSQTQDGVIYYQGADGADHLMNADLYDAVKAMTGKQLGEAPDGGWESLYLSYIGQEQAALAPSIYGEDGAGGYSFYAKDMYGDGRQQIIVDWTEMLENGTCYDLLTTDGTVVCARHFTAWMSNMWFEGNQIGYYGTGAAAGLYGGRQIFPSSYIESSGRFIQTGSGFEYRFFEDYNAVFWNGQAVTEDQLKSHTSDAMEGGESDFAGTQDDLPGYLDGLY